MKQVFPTLDFMGWYSIGIQPTELDLKLHEQVKKKKKNYTQSVEQAN